MKSKAYFSQTLRKRTFHKICSIRFCQNIKLSRHTSASSAAQYTNVPRHTVWDTLLYATLATIVPFYKLLHFAMEIKNKKQICNFSENSKSRRQRFEEAHAAREPQFGHP